MRVIQRTWLIHLYKFSKKKNIWTNNWVGEAGSNLEDDQRPKMTQETQKTKKEIEKIKSNQNLPLRP